MLVISKISFITIISGFNPHITFQQNSLELPKPTFYNSDEVEEIQRIVLSEPEVVIQENVIYINKEEYNCLVKNIYYEAGNQSKAGKQAVAVVTLERVKHHSYPPTICEVVTQKRGRQCQFSWYCDGKSDKPYLDSKDELAAWNRAQKVAEDVLLGRVDSAIKGATMFHADYVNPDWDYSKLKRLAKIGSHIFYKEV
jgi:spore germination cell wall hydrolase CwlJ-like protein